MGFPAGTKQEHRYQTCKDEDCERFPCRVYRDGRRDGYDEGWQHGYAEGYAQGFPDGIAACPLPHGGQ